MSFWLDAILTRQYLCNRLPTSTLPNDVTPFESITSGRKPDLSHLRVWGCECFVAIPDELRPKAGFKRFPAIFVGYEEHRVGWRVRDLKGKYGFSRDVVFNEDLSGRLGGPRSLPSAASTAAVVPPHSPRAVRTRARTSGGRIFDEIILLKEARRLERERRRHLAVAGHGGVVAGGGVDGVVDGGG